MFSLRNHQGIQVQVGLEPTAVKNQRVGIVLFNMQIHVLHKEVDFVSNHYHIQYNP